LKRYFLLDVLRQKSGKSTRIKYKKIANYYAGCGNWVSKSGNGISHVVHMERFGKPGQTLLGSDSHTPAGGGIGMLAMGTCGLDVALASAGEPYYIKMPKIMGIKLTGKLPDWISAKDIVLEMLRRL
jgi:aconitate hydratase